MDASMGLGLSSNLLRVDPLLSRGDSRPIILACSKVLTRNALARMTDCVPVVAYLMFRVQVLTLKPQKSIRTKLFGSSIVISVSVLALGSLVLHAPLKLLHVVLLVVARESVNVPS